MSQKVQLQRFNTFFEYILKWFPDPRDLTWVEVGIYNGRHARRVLKALDDLGYSVQYIGYDLFEDAVLVDLSQSNPGIQQTIRRNPDGFVKTVSYQTIWDKLRPVCSDLTLVKGDTRETLRDLKLGQANLVYIDGGHDYDCVSSDWDAVKNRCQSGCVVVFDDIGWEGVVQTIKDAEDEGFVFYDMDEWRKFTIIS